MTTRLKEFRTKAGISQSALARECCMHSAHLCQIEGGARTSKATAAKIAKALNAAPAEVFPDFAELREG
jgi:transcriptional regulator with XRE-family HTH domain